MGWGGVKFYALPCYWDRLFKNIEKMHFGKINELQSEIVLLSGRVLNGPNRDYLNIRGVQQIFPIAQMCFRL